MIKNIFFDFDGVLAESVNIKTEAFKQMYACNGDEVAGKIARHHVENGGVSRFEKFKI
jgi:beta-phosphoglucomutase-like phosphatase (HAD superfamily)